MEINTHYFESLSLKEVKELLPPNHSIKQVDTQGLQEAGCYFVAILNFYAGKRRRKNISIVRLVLLPVLEDGSQDAKKVECFLCDRYCNELENEMTTMLGSQGTWSADMAGDDVVWVVLHRPFIVPSYRKTSNDFNQLCIIASDKKSPYCQMWLLFTIPCVKVPPSLSHINLMRSNPAVSAKLSVQAQAKYPIKGQACVPPYVPANSKHKIKPLSQAVPRQKISTAGAVISVVKMGYVAKNSVIYDIIKVADGVTGPTSNPTIIFIKIFHNNSIDWPKGGIPRRGHVIVLLDMLCQNYEGRKEGVISTEKVCVFKYKEEHLTCYSNSPGCPHNIENAEEVAVRLFDWFRQHGFLLSSFTEADLPTRKIVDLSGSGLFIINCQVVKKNIYPALVSPMVVLRVRDGTRSPYKFEKASVVLSRGGPCSILVTIRLHEGTHSFVEDEKQETP
ncbi:uncharacterized protein LOC123508961 isoform X1 [Portunus trituberculatus]|uniref:uncharacterized protein LOC123508961 isoform X1 n=1 Tax=Portunus trituberculatus TaxID=210409 RepID=UPI001E1CBB71|nr:uncharacterized protein LOC123508961 isoform X1 [Portunus trituberculatus]